MLTPRSPLTRRIVAALDASPSRIPVLLGGCGSGRSTLLRQIHDRLGVGEAQHVDVERTATTPERFMRAISTTSPFSASDVIPVGTRAAFEATLGFLGGAQTATGRPATFLLDEFLELRTFESFPGLRRVLHEFTDGLATSGNRFVLTSRYVARASRLLRDRSSRFEIIQVPPLSAEDTLGIVDDAARDAAAAEESARTINALADARPVYVRAIVDQLTAMRSTAASHDHIDPVSALVALLAPDGALARLCHFSYELRLHRARGYGALKAILEVLGDEEGLTLTEIAQRLQRTPGSTKDYLSWLEDVDLVTAHRKRYTFSDPVLRLWVRLHCRATAPTEADVAREVQHYALPRMPPPMPAPSPASYAMASAGSRSGLIEID